MADPDHLKKVREGVDAWNAWREGSRIVTPDLAGAILSGADLYRANLTKANLNRANLNRADLYRANLTNSNLSEAILYRANLDMADLSGANLSGADLRRANLTEANLTKANLSGAILSGADLSGANLSGADLRRAYLTEANLTKANFSGANLREAFLLQASLFSTNLAGGDLSGANLNRADLARANLREANLSGANLSLASLVDADITNADFTGCRIFGVSAWRLELSGAIQRNLIITSQEEPEITVDDIEVAQFIYLMLNNQKIRNVIDTITSKVVLILGRFTEERKAVLDALRDELRKRNYLPILFDFDKPTSRNTDETITLLARMARFVIADISDAKSVLQELRGIVSDLPNVPVQPVIIASQEEPGMFDFYRHFPWFLPVHRYDTPAQLVAELSDRVIKPSEIRVSELRGDH